MCYCCWKLEKLVIFIEFVGGRGRPWEALGGRGTLIGWDSLTDLSEPIRGARPPTFGLPRPPIASASHNLSCDLSEPIRASLRLPTFSLPLLASHAHRASQSDPRGRLTDFTAKRIALIGVRERPIRLWARQCDPRAHLTDFTAKCIA